MASLDRTRAPRSFPPTVAGALGLDAMLVVGFAAAGRASHETGVLGEGGMGLLTTAWPFLVALSIGWVFSPAWRAPLAPLRTGVPVWAVTVMGGMLLRALSGQGTAVPFIVVATLTLLALLVGWRLVAAAVVRLGATPGRRAPETGHRRRSFERRPLDGGSAGRRSRMP